MSSFNRLSKPRFFRSAFAALFVILAVQQVVYSKRPAGPSPQSLSALDFLAKLDRGDVKGAHLRLDPDVRRTYAIEKLAIVARGRWGTRADRRIGYEGYVQGAQAQRQSQSAGSMRRPYLVCVVEVPPSGTGGVTYISITSVLRVYVARSEWMIVDFRIGSEPDSSCR
jgi:hypothetical protein